MEYEIAARRATVGKTCSGRALNDGAASDPFISLGSAVMLTKSSHDGTIDDGEIHGADRLKYRDK